MGAQSRDLFGVVAVCPSLSFKVINESIKSQPVERAACDRPEYLASLESELVLDSFG